MDLFVVLDKSGALSVVYVLFHDYVNVRVCSPHNPHHTGHIENYQQNTADLQLVALALPHLILVQFSGPQTPVGWRCVILRRNVPC